MGLTTSGPQLALVTSTCDFSIVFGIFDNLGSGLLPIGRMPILHPPVVGESWVMLDDETAVGANDLLPVPVHVEAGMKFRFVFLVR